MGDTYGDVYRGVFVVRGENVVLLGEIVCPASVDYRNADYNDN